MSPPKLTCERTPPAHFGPYRLALLPETLLEPLRELEAASARGHPVALAFQADLAQRLNTTLGRPTPITFCRSLSNDLGCALSQREDLSTPARTDQQLLSRLCWRCQCGRAHHPRDGRLTARLLLPPPSAPFSSSILPRLHGRRRHWLLAARPTCVLFKAPGADVRGVRLRQTATLKTPINGGDAATG